MKIGVDFDGTLFEERDYPDCGLANRNLIKWLRRRQEEGDDLILFTCREGDALSYAIGRCAMEGLTFKCHNKNTKESIEVWGDSRKIYADLYIDDKANKFNFILEDHFGRDNVYVRGGWEYKDVCPSKRAFCTFIFKIKNKTYYFVEDI